MATPIHSFLLTFSMLFAASEYAGAGSAGPNPAAPTAPIVAPQDKPYAGVIRIAVNAADLDRRVFHVHESIPVSGSQVVLLYPKWIPGEHAPTGPLDRFAGFVIHAGSAAVEWTRDPVDVFAFHVNVPRATQSQAKNPTILEIDFDYLSSVSEAVGVTEVDPNILILEWNHVVLYPAGFYSRQIAVEPSVTLPNGWAFASALEATTTTGATKSFKPVSLEMLVDSPIYAGKYSSRVDLDPGSAAPVHLNLFGDSQNSLNLTPEQLAPHRALIQQAGKVFGSHHYSHYDFLVSVSDTINAAGLEHHQSSEDGFSANCFTEWDKTSSVRDLLPHEFAHSWNGKFRRPEDLWTPNYNVPMRNSLLWVYEGQTQFWGYVLAARSGLWTKEQALDAIAVDAATFDTLAGRSWRALQDTTNDEIINPRRPQSWRSWQRFEDYYQEGMLIWLDADTLIRERSHGQRSLDDFARAFFGVDNGSVVPVAYSFKDIVNHLNAVQPYDWNAFLHSRVDKAASSPPLDGVHRGGYKLVFTDQPGDYQKSVEGERKTTDLKFSIGVTIDKDGKLQNVQWGSAAFKAGLTAGVQIVAVNEIAYDADKLKEVIKANTGAAPPIEMIVKNNDRFRTVRIDYHDGLRYPHLQRDASQAAMLDDILTARK